MAILNLPVILKYPLFVILLIPLLAVLAAVLMLIGQKPDSFIRAFTDTYKQGLSQLDYECANVECGGHFLCSVGANGHRRVVQPVRYGTRAGKKIICTRQLLISNAFEELLAQCCPAIHRGIRKNYNRVGKMIHRHYHFFAIKWVSDLIYILMKPAEWSFLLTLYIFTRKPENRIAQQYLLPSERNSIAELESGQTHGFGN